MYHITMRHLKEVTKFVVIQLTENIQKINTPEFQENFTFTYDGTDAVATFEHQNGNEIVTFDIYGIKTGFQLPLDGPRETASEYVNRVYGNSEWIADEYLRINKKQIKIKYEKIKTASKLN